MQDLQIFILSGYLFNFLAYDLIAGVIYIYLRFFRGHALKYFWSLVNLIGAINLRLFNLTINLILWALGRELRLKLQLLYLESMGDILDVWLHLPGLFFDDWSICLIWDDLLIWYHMIIYGKLTITLAHSQAKSNTYKLISVYLIVNLSQ